MVKVKDIYSFIDSFAPYDTQVEFDNSGYMVGDKNAEVKRIIVSLDVTSEVLEEAKKTAADLIVAHHPVIFNPLENIMSDSLVYKIIESGVSVISAHTNLDIAERGVNDSLFKALGVIEYRTSEEDEFLKIAEIEPVSSDELVKTVSHKLNAAIQYNNVKKTVKTLAICSGSGSSTLPAAINENVDAFITGEAKYNFFIDANEKGLLLIAAGHFNTENVVVPVLADMLRKQFPEIEIIESDEKNPVNYYLG